MLVNKIVSTFGDHSSLVPIFTKDVVNSLGMTGFSYDAGGKIEAKDRFIDEFGTMGIWLGGLPIFKGVLNKTLYKAFKLNPNIDTRLIKDKEQLEIAKKYAKTVAEKLGNPEIEASLLKASEKSKLFKGLFLGKFAAATALTLASFFTLVKIKQSYTRKQIERDFWERKSQEHFYNNNVANSPAFKGFKVEENAGKVNKANNKNISFKGAGSVMKGIGNWVSGAAFDPVKNLFLVDAGITGERLGSSRTKTEFAEYAIKEGSLLFFLYVAGKYVQKGIEKFSEKVLKRPIDLHAEVLSSKELKESIKNGSLAEDVKKFSKDLSKTEIFDFLHNESNKENLVVKAAKKSGLAKTIKTKENGLWGSVKWLFNKGKDTGIIDPHQFISKKDLTSLAESLENLANSPKLTKQGLDKYLKTSTRFKIGSVVANMGISCLFLGLVVPYAMMKYRQKQNGNKEFHVQSEIQKEMEKNFKGRIA